jgi:hypothetical protein
MPPLLDLQRHLAWCAVAPTTLRGMLAVGGRRLVCNYLSGIDLTALRDGVFPPLLDRWSDELSGRLDQRWGPARKAINLFLRDVTYNVWLRDAHSLPGIEAALELPLDGVIMSAIRRLDSTGLPKVSVIGLTRELSEGYQQAAAGIAAAKGIARVHLDVVLWPPPA